MGSDPTRAPGMETIANSSNQGDTRHNSTTNSQLPTHSTDQLRLSRASSVSSNQSSFSLKGKGRAVDVPTPEDDSTTLAETSTSEDDESTIAGDTVVEKDEIHLTINRRRGSGSSIRSFMGDNDRLSTRSRSTSSATTSSNNSVQSMQVDWEELEKSEEQVPRDEGSEEVGEDSHVHVNMLTSYSPRHSSLPDWSKRTTPWPAILSQR